MGVSINISANTFPKQSASLGKSCKVMFHYTKPELTATIIREDMELPYVTILQLEDGRVVLSTECQWQPPQD